MCAIAFKPTTPFDKYLFLTKTTAFPICLLCLSGLTLTHRNITIATDPNTPHAKRRFLIYQALRIALPRFPPANLDDYPNLKHAFWRLAHLVP